MSPHPDGARHEETVASTARMDRAAQDARDRDWVMRIRTGDDVAFAAMYRAYKNDLGAYVTSIVRSGDAAEEVIHDLLLRIWEQRHTWEFPGALGAYLFRAARNRALDYLRHERVAAAYRKRVEGTPFDGDAASVAEPTAPAALEEADLDRAVDRALMALPPRCREAFLLNRRHHLSYAQVAEVMGISPKTVEVQMTRALRELKGALGPLLAGGA